MTLSLVSSTASPMRDTDQAFVVEAGGAQWALPARAVQSVFRPIGLTPVPLAPPVVVGLVNLRGRVVLAIDLARRLLGARAPPRAGRDAPLAVAVERGADVYALLVDGVGDVVSVDATACMTPPAHLSADLARMTALWFRTADGILPLLDLYRLLEIDIDRRSGSDRRAYPPTAPGAKP